MANLHSAALRGESIGLGLSRLFSSNAPASAFLVVCVTDVYNRLQGRYAAQLTVNGAVIAHHVDRAARYHSQAGALEDSVRLSCKFSGTTWAVMPVDDTGSANAA